MAQRSFIRKLYKQVNGCYTLVSNEFAAAYNAVCPTQLEVRDIVSEGEEIERKSDTSSPDQVYC